MLELFHILIFNLFKFEAPCFLFLGGSIISLITLFKFEALRFLFVGGSSFLSDILNLFVFGIPSPILFVCP